MKSSILQNTRWTLIALLTGIILYLAYSGVSGFISMMLKADGSFESISGIIFFVFMLGFLILIPSIMLRSLIIKKLKGFAACIGLFICLGAFIAAVTLPSKLGLFALWESVTVLPIPIKIFIGLAMGITFLVFPYWLLFRAMRWTNDWFYPKLLQPLEQKI